MYYEANKKQRKKYQKKWQTINKGKANAISAKYRAKKLKATPTWLTKEQNKQIKLIYCMAKILKLLYNKNFHVDHIIPLQNSLVSGLHVPKNLVLMRGIENETKRNIYII